MPSEFVLNGRRVSIEDECDGTLLDFLRARGLTGAKEGCAEGECGACAVVLVAGHGAASSAYRPVNSCLMPLALAADHEIYTVESLAEGGQLAPVQQAMAEAGGSQCGYCTPGFVMSLMAEQYRPGRSGPCDPLAMAGNLCRCTGYRPIRDAALTLGPPPAGALRDRLDRPAPRIAAVSAPGFSRPSSIGDSVAALAAHPDATLIAGGTDLGVEWNLHHRRWTHLISLEAIDELRMFSETPQSVMLGAALPLADIERLWTNAPPVLQEWLTLFASPLIRNRHGLDLLAEVGPAAILDACACLLDLELHFLEFS
jgi:xanthine dehydrogenase small subunit